MILWFVLFALVVAISFVLAAKSMRDFTEIPPANQQYGLFLIRKMAGLSGQFIDSLHDDSLQTGLNIAFERLFKGNRCALVVFGPRKPLLKYQDSLDLLELEDYTNVSSEDTFVWEIGIKSTGEGQKVFDNLPQFLETEQFWWQLVLWAGKSAPQFHTQIRAVLISADLERRKDLTQKLQSVLSDKLIKLPKAFSNTQMLDFYKKRSFQKNAQKNPQLNSEEILQLIVI